MDSLYSRDKGAVVFMSNEEVMTRIKEYFADFPSSYFLDGILKLDKRLDKFILLKIDDIEKYNNK